MNYLGHHFKVLNDYLFLLMSLLKMLQILKELYKTIESIFFRDERLNYQVLIDGRNFHDQPVNDLIKQYDEVTKVSKG